MSELKSCFSVRDIRVDDGVRVKLGGLTALVGSGVCLTEVVRGVCEQEIS